MRRALPIVLAAVMLCACGASSQRKAIRHARISIEAADIAWEAADAAVASAYAEKPADDEESYCKNKIAAVMFAQVDLTMAAAADTVHAWEVSLDVYEAKKAAGTVGDVDWQNVLSSEADWLKVASSVAAGLGVIRDMMVLWGVKLPAVVDKVWSFVASMGGRAPASFEVDYSSLKDSICNAYLPGGE